MFAEILNKVRLDCPLVHCITNYVTVNDCANVLLACGASPVMADDEREAEEIVSIASALVINIGTLNSRTIPSMFKAGRRANELGRPVILDPVGAGASSLRTATAMDLMREIDFAVIRGNISEITSIAGGESKTRGVDASASELLDGDLPADVISLILKLREKDRGCDHCNRSQRYSRRRKRSIHSQKRPSHDVKSQWNRVHAHCNYRCLLLGSPFRYRCCCGFRSGNVRSGWRVCF